MERDRMGSAEAIHQLPPALQSLLTWERFHLHKADTFQSTRRDPSFDRRYFPQNCNALRIPCYWVKRKFLFIHQYGDTTPECSPFVNSAWDEPVLLPIHPMDVESFESVLASVSAKSAEADIWIWGVPTSSTRTFLAWPNDKPENSLFFKLSLQSDVFGDRRISRLKAAQGVGMSLLTEAGSAGLPATLGFFAERLSAVPRLLQDYGVIYRSIPSEVKNGMPVVAPLFAMFGESSGRRPLFVELLESTSQSPQELVREVFCRKFARLWLELSFGYGLLLEAHAQDLLLGLSRELRPLGTFFYRDFEGLGVDWELRRARQLGQPQLPYSSAWYSTYGTWGYPYYQLIWQKMKVSLHDYMHLVLNELDQALIQWQTRGMIGGALWRRNEATELFSKELRSAIEEMFDVKVSGDFNVYYSQNRFVIQLMEVRKEIIRR